MVQSRNRACFASEALGELRFGHFDCDIPIQPGIVGLIHLAHAARADGREDLVRPELCARGERHIFDSAKCIRSTSVYRKYAGLEITAGSLSRWHAPPQLVKPIQYNSHLIRRTLYNCRRLDHQEAFAVRSNVIGAAKNSLEQDFRCSRTKRWAGLNVDGHYFVAAPIKQLFSVIGPVR